MNKVSLVVPCYNEESSVLHFYETVCKFYTNHLFDKIELEFVFVNDGSKDATWQIIHNLISATKPHNIEVTAVNFSKNFGKEAAVFAGIQQSTGDCIVTIDADLQHPIDVIPEMIAFWEEGYKVVDGVKSNRGKEAFIYKKMSALFYKLISKCVGFDMKNSSDFKLIDREVASVVLSLPEKHTFFRGLTSWVGFPHKEIYYEVLDRQFGQTKWSYVSLTKYAIKNISSFSAVPMLIILYVGIMVLILSLILGVYTIVSYFLGNTVSGYSTLLITMLIVGSSNMIGLGIIGYYVSKIFEQVQNRPNFIISEVFRSDENCETTTERSL